METFLILAPPLVGIIALGYVVAANLLRVWLKHRVKLALLEKLQHDPAHAEALADLEVLLEQGRAGSEGRRLDYRVFGVTLAGFGMVSLAAAWLFGGPEWMTGAYFGGVICLAVGFILALLGLILRYVERLPGDFRQRSQK